QVSGTDASLFGVVFVNASVGTAVGLGGTILRTTDGGTTWTLQYSGTTSHLFAVAFVNPNTGWAVGDPSPFFSFTGTILHTTDGGATWMHQYSGSYTALFAVTFADANTGVVVGDQGYALITADGGQHWRERRVTSAALFGASMVNPTTATL